MRTVALTAAAMLLAPADAVAPARRGPIVAAPGLNHVYVVLDQATFDAIRGSHEVEAILGPNDIGLPVYAPSTATADRIFLRGRQTYLELFAPKNRFDEPVGKVGIGIGADRKTDFRRIDAGWRHVCGAGLDRAIVSWNKTQPPVPWYESLSCAATSFGSELVLWAMLYRPEFHRWRSGSAPAKAQVSRRAMLADRAAARQGRFDVTALTLDVTPAAFARIAPQLDAAGMQRSRSTGTVRWTGDGWSLTLRPDRNPPHIRSIELTAFDTQRIPPSPRLTLGNGALVRTRADRLELKLDR